MTKLLKDLSVAEVESLLLCGEDEDGNEVEYSYTVTGYGGKEYTHSVVFDHWNKWDEVAEYQPVFFLPGLGRVEVIHHDGGGEGATDMQMVFQVTSLIDGSQRLFAINGYWVSHDGGYWDGPFKETTRQEKVVVFYE